MRTAIKGLLFVLAMAVCPSVAHAQGSALVNRNVGSGFWRGATINLSFHDESWISPHTARGSVDAFNPDGSPLWSGWYDYVIDQPNYRNGTIYWHRSDGPNWFNRVEWDPITNRLTVSGNGGGVFYLQQ